MWRAINDEGIRKLYRNGKTVIEVDTHKARFWGMPVSTLGSYGRRKFENLLFLEHANNKEQLVFCYGN